MLPPPLIRVAMYSSTYLLVLHRGIYRGILVRGNDVLFDSKQLLFGVDPLCASNRLRDAARRIVLHAVGHPRLEQFHVGLLAPRCLEFLDRNGTVLLSVLRDDVHGAPLRVHLGHDHVRPYHTRSNAEDCTNAFADVHDFIRLLKYSRNVRQYRRLYYRLQPQWCTYFRTVSLFWYTSLITHARATQVSVSASSTTESTPFASVPTHDPPFEKGTQKVPSRVIATV